MLSLNIFQLICSICTNDKYELRIRLNTNYNTSIVCLGLICQVAENYSICNIWNELILSQLVDFSSPSFTSCLQSCFLDPVEGGHRGVSPSQLFHLLGKLSFTIIALIDVTMADDFSKVDIVLLLKMMLRKALAIA